MSQENVPEGPSHREHPAVIVVLGAANNEDGRLSTAALARVQAGLRAYHSRPGSLFILTGGYGENFNRTEKPHAHYLAEWLTANGVPPADILGLAESRNTVEDALLTLRILGQRHLGRRQEGRLVVVTSDFHVPRSRLIFQQVFPETDLEFIAAAAALSPEARRRAEDHERAALRRIHEQGGLVLPDLERIGMSDGLTQ